MIVNPKHVTKVVEDKAKVLAAVDLDGSSSWAHDEQISKDLQGLWGFQWQAHLFHHGIAGQDLLGMRKSAFGGLEAGRK